MQTPKQKHRLIIMVSLLFAFGGFLLPFWPLELMGIAIAALTGRWVTALIIALILDIAYGAPFGHLHFLLFPFTAFALAGILARTLSLKYLIQKSPQNRI